ncbi:hypothetical protein Q6348_08940 [Isoptericola sp. b441]|uniref:Uncharacterized protein n=1 Tax=Actinotalea lenta TaxID=3064654 RepID=A0ABT9DAZ5_9CELL|nr:MULTISPECIES: hypothetical protein [unclassified Isoptericola]MDO8107318.1 hypothetical protein [Isoptericola sp. b441]MDO8121019.1 hypothetical protein [Isoptericola sp. b490]
MGPVLTALVLAVVAAAVVLVVASRAASDETGESFVSALRAGLHHEDGVARVGVFAAARRELAESADADGSGLEDLFRSASTEHPAYVAPTDLIARVRPRAHG